MKLESFALSCDSHSTGKLMNLANDSSGSKHLCVRGVIAAGDEHIAGGLIATHREFVLNVTAASMIHAFDRIDFSSSRVAD